MTGDVRRAVAGVVAVPLRVRTFLGRGTAARHLEALELALIYEGWRCLRLYAPAAGPLMRVYAGSAAREVGTLVTVQAARDGGWCYRWSSDGRWLVPCGDTRAAAQRLGDQLKPRMFPGTFPSASG